MMILVGKSGQQSRVADPKLLISDPDPDPTGRVISDPDLDPAPGSFWIWIRILVSEIFVKLSHLKSECTLKGHFCTEIKLFVLIPNGNFVSGSGSYSSAYFGSGSGSWKVKVSDPYGSGSATLQQSMIKSTLSSKTVLFLVEFAIKENSHIYQHLDKETNLGSDHLHILWVPLPAVFL